MQKGIVFDIQRFSLHDGPGVRTVLFLKGCSLRCKWCCNPESQLPWPEIVYTKSKCIYCEKCISACPSHSLVMTTNGIKVDYDRCNACGLCGEKCLTNALELCGKEYTVDDVVPILIKDHLYYEISGGGVTLSGGEPLLQAEFAAEVQKRLKDLRINTAIETAGFVGWESFVKVIDYTDLFLYDLKHLHEDEHKKGTGEDNKAIISNLNKLLDLGKKVIIRIPLIPRFNTEQGYIFKLIDFLNGKRIEAIHLLPYHRLGINKYEKKGLKYELPDLLPPTNEEIGRIENEFSNKLNVQVVVEG